VKHGCGKSLMTSPGAGGLGDVYFEKGIVMADDSKDELGDMLADGWEVCGYTVNILPLGAQVFHILLRKENSLVNFVITKNGNQDVRGSMVLAPYTPAPKKGFFG
jgi:hypothetical protein